MVIYTSGTVEALVVFKASDGKKGLLWIPSLARKQNYDKLEQYSLGKWLRFDMGADKIVEPMETGPYESHQGSASPLVSGLNTPVPLAEVRAPVVFFSDTQYFQSIGYSLAFGRIASIADGTPTIPMDTLCHAWIGYISLFRNNALRHWLKSFDVNWALSDMPEPFTKAELKAAHEKSLIQLQNGIVVGREENVELGLDADQAAKPGMPKTCTVLKIWTAEAGNQVCIHRIISTEAEGTGNDDSKAAFAVGDWCRFLPFKNWSLSMSAVSPYAIKAPEGISLVQTEPTLKLKISHEHYKLDQDPDASRLHVPKWLGTIESPWDFIHEFRTARQRRPKMAPRLFVELCPHSLSWLPVDFDGRACSPPPPSHYQPQPTATIATKAHHGSEKQFTAYRNPPRIISTSDSSTGSGSNTEGSCVTVVQKSASSTTIKQEEQQPESNKETNVEEEEDKEQQVEPPVSGSFGRSRKRDCPAPSSTANRSQSASSNQQQQRSSSSQAQQKVGVEGAKASVSRESLAAESTSPGIKKEAEDRPPRPPSIASDFGKGDDDDDEENNDANADDNQSQPPPRGGKATGSFGQSTSSSSSSAAERIHDGLFVYTAADLRRDREASNGNGSEPPTFLESASRTAAAARRPPPAGRRQFPNTSAGSSYRPQATRAGSTTDFGESRRGPAGPAAGTPPRPPFPPRGVPPQTLKPRINRNLSGVVTSTSPDGGVFIYTPAYPRREIYVPRTLVRPEVQQGSWLLFDAIEDRDGPKIGTYTVEERPPFETIPVGNSILLKLRACVPLRWNPVLSTHNPVVPTDFVEEVVDYQGLLNQDCENEQIPVIVLRRTPEQAAQDPRFPGNPWVIERINDW